MMSFQALLASAKSEAKRLDAQPLMLKQMSFLDQPPHKISYAVLQIPSRIPPHHATQTLEPSV